MCMKTEVLENLNELKHLVRDLGPQLEDAGLRFGGDEASIAKAHLFDAYLKSIVSATEGLLRGEPAERHNSRLSKDLPPAFEALRKIKNSEPGRAHAAALEHLERLLTFINEKYRQI